MSWSVFGRKTDIRLNTQEILNLTHIPRRRRASIAEHHVPHQGTRSPLLRNSRDAGRTHGGELDDYFTIFGPGKVRVLRGRREERSRGVCRKLGLVLLLAYPVEKGPGENHGRTPFIRSPAWHHFVTLVKLTLVTNQPGLRGSPYRTAISGPGPFGGALKTMSPGSLTVLSPAVACPTKRCQALG